MKIRSLLAAVSMVALAVGTAHANPLLIEMDDTNGNLGDSQEMVINLANETQDDFVWGDVTPVYLEFAISDGDGTDFQQADSLEAIITLPDNMVFADRVTSAVATEGLDGNSGSTILAGGIAGDLGNRAAGDNQVRFSFSVQDGGAPRIGFRIPVKFTAPSCSGKSDASYRLRVTLTNEIEERDVFYPDAGDFEPVGNDIFGGDTMGPLTPDDSGTVIQCTDAINAMIESDEFLVDQARDGEVMGNSVIALNTYTTFINNPVKGEFRRQRSSAALGSVQYKIDEDAVVWVGSGKADNDTMSRDDVTQIDFDVDFGKNLYGLGNTSLSRAGIQGSDKVTYNYGYYDELGEDESKKDINTIHHSLTEEDKDFIINNDYETWVTVSNDESGNAIKEQSVNVVNSVVFFGDDHPFIESESGSDLVCTDTDLDFLQRQGRNFGFFDWVGSSDGTLNVWRVTGLGKFPEHPLDVDVVFENSSKDWAYNEVQGRITIQPEDMTHGEYVITTNNLAQIFEDAGLDPDFERIDVKFQFLSESPNIDVDRLQATSDGSLNDYGGGANFARQIHTPATDGDQQLSSE